MSRILTTILTGIVVIPPCLSFNPFILMAYDAPNSENNKILHTFVGTSILGPPLVLITSPFPKTNSVVMATYLGMWWTSFLLFPYGHKNQK